jgi:hypothetical protein
VRRAFGACLLMASVLTVSWQFVSNTSANAVAGRPCIVSSLKVTQSGSGGLGHSWLVIILRNTSNTICKIHGYPTIAVHLASGSLSTMNGPAKKSKPGSTVKAIDQIDIYGGGVSGHHAHQRLTLPVVSLKPHAGSASFVIGWSALPGGSACPWFRSFTFGWGGRQVNIRTSSSPLCTQIDATPIVPGKSGDFTESG